MKKYNLIFLRPNKVLLTNKMYETWREIQDEYNDYITSLEFVSIEEVVEYIRIDYKLDEQKAMGEVSKIEKHETNTVELLI
jgi:hypothetical protein